MSKNRALNKRQELVNQWWHESHSYCTVTVFLFPMIFLTCDGWICNYLNCLHLVVHYCCHLFPQIDCFFIIWYYFHIFIWCNRGPVWQPGKKLQYTLKEWLNPGSTCQKKVTRHVTNLTNTVPTYLLFSSLRLGCLLYLSPS